MWPLLCPDNARKPSIDVWIRNMMMNVARKNKSSLVCRQNFKSNISPLLSNSFEYFPAATASCYFCFHIVSLFVSLWQNVVPEYRGRCLYLSVDWLVCQRDIVPNVQHAFKLWSKWRQRLTVGVVQEMAPAVGVGKCRDHWRHTTKSIPCEVSKDYVMSPA